MPECKHKLECETYLMDQCLPEGIGGCFEAAAEAPAPHPVSPSNSSDLLWYHTARMTSLLIEGLNTDGAHHKQYFLEEVLRVMVPDEFKDCKASWQWENGIAP